nr:division/cell wall cluster transcriptional repressor MraZ [Croceivirga thetidis]
MSHPNKGKDFRIWLRKFTAGLKDDVTIDKDSGRMQIPKVLFDHVGLGKAVVLNAAHTVIEIWDKAKYEGMLDSMSDERYDEISEEIFNGGGQPLP